MTISEIKASKTDKQWERLYNSYIKNYNKLSERLEGNVHDAMSFVEYKDVYANLYIGGVRQNITRTIVSKEAIVSSRQANIGAVVLKEMAIRALIEQEETGEITLAQSVVIDIAKLFKGSLTKIKNYLRKHPELLKFLSDAAQEQGNSFSEYIPSP